MSEVNTAYACTVNGSWMQTSSLTHDLRMLLSALQLQLITGQRFAIRSCYGTGSLAEAGPNLVQPRSNLVQSTRFNARSRMLCLIWGCTCLWAQMLSCTSAFLNVAVHCVHLRTMQSTGETCLPKPVCAEDFICEPHALPESLAMPCLSQSSRTAYMLHRLKPAQGLMHSAIRKCATPDPLPSPALAACDPSQQENKHDLLPVCSLMQAQQRFSACICLVAGMAPRTRQQAQGKVQPKLEELPKTKPAGRKRKAAAAAPSQPNSQKAKADAAKNEQKPAGQAQSSEEASHEGSKATHEKPSSGKQVRAAAHAHMSCVLTQVAPMAFNLFT